MFDFAAGFYSISVDLDSQPYITFYIEGHGYFAYQRMPFGVTGGPSEFGHVMAQHFHDLIAQAVLELFIDDGGIVSNSFEKGIEKLKTLLMRVRNEKMSLLPSKLHLFMTDAVFAGAQVGPQGVIPCWNSNPKWGFRTQNFRGGLVFFRSLTRKFSFSGTSISMEKINSNVPAAKLPKKAKDWTSQPYGHQTLPPEMAHKAEE